MSPRLKSLVLLLAVLTAAALWRAGQAQRAAVSRETPPAASPSLKDTTPTLEPEENLPGVKGRERVLIVGHRLHYTFDLDLRTHTEHPPGTRASLHTGWSGLLELTYLGAEGEQRLFSCHLVPTRVDVASGETPLPDDAALQALQVMFERPVYVGQDVRGRVVAVHFDAAQDAPARRLVRLLLASTQFVAEDGPRWSAEEPDSRGDIEAVYRAGGSANTYVKTKRRYLRAGSVGLPRLQGHLDFTLFADGHVKEATGSEVVELGGGGAGLPRIREETRVALTNVGVDHRLSSLRPFEVARATLRSERLTAWAGEAGAALDKQFEKGATLEDLLRALAKREGLDTARLRLTALFRQSLADVDRAAAMLRQGAADEVRSEHLLEALARAGTPEAQRALVSVLEGERVRPKTQAHAARVVGRMERPSLLLGDALERVMDGARVEGVRSAAALSIGGLAKTLEVPAPGRSQALVEGLVRRCRSGAVGLEVCLDALARAGAPVGLAYVKAALVHPEAAVRGAATEALSAIPGVAVDALLDQVMLDDPSARVRVRAVRAASQRVAGAHLETLARVLRVERSERVRIEVVRLLGPLQAVEAPAKALLRDVAANDGSVKVRSLAASLLGE